MAFNPYSKLKINKKKAKPGDLLMAANKMNQEGIETGKGGGKKIKGTIPKTKRGKAQVAKLGRKKKTGGFAKIAKSAAKKYGSAEAGKRVAGAIFNRMVQKHKNA